MVEEMEVIVPELVPRVRIAIPSGGPDGQDIDMFEDLAVVLDPGDDPATISDADFLDRVAEFCHRPPGTFSHLKVSKPATGNVLVTTAYEYG